MAASILARPRSYLIRAVVSHSQRITNSDCDLYQRSDVCMRQMLEEAEETQAVNEWIIGLMKRSYRYRILSPVICLLSLPYLARQKYSLSQTAGVCMNVQPLGILLLFCSFVSRPDRSLGLLFCGRSSFSSSKNLLLCFVSPQVSVKHDVCFLFKAWCVFFIYYYSECSSCRCNIIP